MGDFQRRALITGITGQDGSYLAELLLSKGYEVFGIIRRSSSFNTERIDHIWSSLQLFHGDMLDAASLRRALAISRPHEVYNLAAQSHVAVSFEEPVYTTQTIADGTLHLFEAVRELQSAVRHQIRIYQASSSEMFGNSPPPQSETTPFAPCSPYACAKVLAHHAARMYRNAYDMFIACGVLFNHEGPRRGMTFVTRKITRGACRIKVGLDTRLELGNLAAIRDWGDARDYVEAMWLLLQQDTPTDCVIATGEAHSVRDFAIEVFSRLGLSYDAHVVGNTPKYMRPHDVNYLCGDSSLARRVLSWEPHVTYSQLIDEMIAADMRRAQIDAGIAAVA